MQRSFEYLWLTAKTWKPIIIEILVSTFRWLDEKHLVKITRPTIDEKLIRDNIAMKYSQELANWLLLEEIQKNMEIEINQRIKSEEKRISELPKNVIFIWYFESVQNLWSSQKLKIGIPVNIAEYIIKNHYKINEMFIDLDKIPFFADEYDNAKAIIEQFSKFEDIYWLEVYENKDHYDVYKKIITTVEFSKNLNKSKN